MKSIKSKMSYIRVNDVFDDLSEENKRLGNELMFANKCLNVLIGFKTNFDLIIDKLKTNLSSTELKIFVDLSKEYKNVLKEKEKYLNRNTNIGENDGLNEEKAKNLNKSNEKQTNESIAKQKIKTEEIPKSTAKLNEVNDKRSDESFVKQSLKRPKIANKVKLKTDMKSIERKGKTLKYKSNYCKNRTKATKESNKQIRSQRSKAVKTNCSYSECDFYYVLKRDYYSHLNESHNQFRPFACNTCGMGFKTDDYLRSHVRSVHTIDRRFRCDFDDCENSYKTKNNLIRHKASHTTDRPFACNRTGCAFRTHTHQNLKRHIQYQHLNPVKSIDCPVEGCLYRCKVQSNLKQHIIRVHNKCPSDESLTQFRCDFIGCLKSFKSKAYLSTHQRIHSTDPNQVYRCDWPGCEYSANIKTYVSAHQLSHSDECRYGCNWPDCGKRFKGKSGLYMHLKVHNDDKRFACYWPGCQYRTLSNSSLALHVKRHKK